LVALRKTYDDKKQIEYSSKSLIKIDRSGSKSKASFIFRSSATAFRKSKEADRQ